MNNGALTNIFLKGRTENFEREGIWGHVEFEDQLRCTGGGGLCVC